MGACICLVGTARAQEEGADHRESQARRRTHKFGIEVPNTVEQALDINHRTGTTFWRDAIDKEFTNVRPAFDIRHDITVGPPGFKEIRCHLIIDVNAETLTRKARFVAGGHMTDPPKDAVYSWLSFVPIWIEVLWRQTP
jgi:hypothetical protein